MKGFLCYDRSTGRKEMFYLTTQSTYFIYGYVASESKYKCRNAKRLGVFVFVLFVFVGVLGVYTE